METKLIQNDDENRFEIYHKNQLFGFTQGSQHADHVFGARLLVGIAQAQGLKVELVDVDLDKFDDKGFPLDAE